MTTVHTLAPTVRPERRDASVLPQRLSALARANEARFDAAAVKREVAAGLPFAAALADERAQGMKIGVLLLSLPRWGTVRVGKTLGRLLIGEHRRVRDLTANQKSRLESVV